jgi:NADPH:quinone reductase-like Zn-dependent oxidoreductase
VRITLKIAMLVPAAILIASLPVPTFGQTVETMKAVRLHAHGKTSDVLHYEDAPKPSPTAGQLLVAVHAASIIPGDWKTRNGVFGDLSAHMPMVMGYDVSGVVESVGAGVEAFKPGDEVFAYLPDGGAFAEYAVGPAKVFARKPANITHAQAAGVPVSGLAAWYALMDVAKLQSGQAVLIQAGAGGVGHFAVQIAHSTGATVITTASLRNHEFLRKLGADVVIDYNTQQFEEVVSDVDVVFDMIGGDVQERSFQVLKPGGYLVAINQRPSPEKLEQYGVRGSFLATRSDGAVLSLIAEQIKRGAIVPHVSRVFPLSETAAAMDLNEKGHTRGKIVVQVR